MFFLYAWHELLLKFSTEIDAELAFMVAETLAVNVV